MKNIKYDVWWAVEDGEGRLICWKPANSWVLASLDCMYAGLCATASSYQIRDITGTLRNFGIYDGRFFFKTSTATAGATNVGIVVGTGTNAVSLADYKLQSQIGHGTGSGQLQYGNTSFTLPYTDGSKRVYLQSRPFTNLSGAGVTVNEVGLYCQNDGNYFCYERSLLTFTVPNTETRTVSFTISVTV